jgi:glycosyltransferase involved in cell wall biosynthesis
MKILIIDEALDSILGGISTHCKNLKINLEIMGDTVDFLSIEKFKYRSIFNRKIVSSKILEEYIKNTDYDIYHFHGIITSLFGLNCMKVAGKLGKKIVFTPHYHPFRYFKQPILVWLYFKFQVQPVIKEHEVICLSKNELHFFSNKTKKAHLIPGGHSVENKCPHHKGNYILFVGRLDKNKNFEFIQNNVNFLEIRAVIPTAPPTNNNYHNIKYFSQISDVELSHLYQQALCTVVPSKYEALSLVALESLAHGTPVIVSDRVQVKDYFSSNVCRVYPYQNSQKFTEELKKINSMTNDEYYEASLQCIREAQHLKWEKMTEKVKCVYKSLIKS